MPTVDIIVSTKTSDSLRVEQISSMFDCPREKKQTLRWNIDLPLDSRPWNVGLIVGPSGCGKSTIARELWPKQMDEVFQWGAASVIDDFDESLSIEEIAEVCQAVGFNTIPAWMRPYRVLSNGERFRVSLARRLLSADDLVVIDEFSSVVDRRVAQIASYAVQKYIRRSGRRFVACSCHSDVIEWLQPDWICEPNANLFTWRCLRQRPEISIIIRRVSYGTWRLFAPFHYMNAELNRFARCFGLFVDDRIATFAGIPRTRE